VLDQHIAVEALIMASSTLGFEPVAFSQLSGMPSLSVSVGRVPPVIAP